MEEERRLMYVGITRAREHLLITHARYRTTFGQMEHQTPSRFLSELPSALLTHQDCSHWQSQHMRDYLATWLQVKMNTVTASIVTFSTPLPKKPSPAQAPTTSTSTWKNNQPVKHQTFGIGIIKKVEYKDMHKIYITAQFKEGLKKVDAKFLQAV